jgi:hypothetical protein
MRIDGQESHNIVLNRKPTDVEHMIWSHATKAFRNGVIPGAGINDRYVRDPGSGTWYKDNHGKPRVDYIPSNSDLTMRYMDTHRKGKQGAGGTIVWPMSSPNGFHWTQPSHSDAGLTPGVWDTNLGASAARPSEKKKLATSSSDSFLGHPPWNQSTRSFSQLGA